MRITKLPQILGGNWMAIGRQLDGNWTAIGRPLSRDPQTNTRQAYHKCISKCVDGWIDVRADDVDASAAGVQVHPEGAGASKSIARVCVLLCEFCPARGDAAGTAGCSRSVDTGGRLGIGGRRKNKITCALCVLFPFKGG